MIRQVRACGGLAMFTLWGITLGWSQGFGDAPGQSSIPEGILKFGLYGKEWVDIGYAGKTADSGAVGSAGYVQMAQDAVIRWDTYAGDEVRGNTNNKILGNLTADGKVVFNNLLTIEKNLWAKDSLRLDGAGGSNLIKGNTAVGVGLKLGYGNTFAGSTTVPNGVISVMDNNHTNTFGITALMPATGTQLLAGTHTSPSLSWNTAFTRPLQWDSMTYNIPSTSVNFDDSKDCALDQFETWDNSATTCALFSGAQAAALQTAPDGSKVLPPGSYGDFSFLYQSNMTLGEGIYHFKSLTLNGAQARIPIWQPTGGRTQILVEGDVQLNQDQFMLRPASNATDFLKADTATNLEIKGGSVLLYSNGANVVLGQFTYVWGSVMAPNALIDVRYDSRLFGQALGKQIKVAQNFEGNNGRYIPFYPTKPKIGLVFSGGNLINEGSGGGTKVYPITFSMDHENGLPVKVYFHTNIRTPAQNGYANASDFTGVAKDSVEFPVGIVSVPFTKITVNQDNQFELDDYFDLVLDSVVNGRIDSVAANNSYALGIRNDDAPPVMEFVDTTTLTVSEALASQALATELSAASIVNATANVNRTARTGTMSSTIPATHTIGPGLTAGSLLLSWINDGIDEPNDTVRVALRTGSSMSVGKDSVKTIIITDDDASVKLAGGMQTVYSINEPSGALTATTTLKIPIVLAGVSGWPIPWSFALVPAGATGAQLDQDYSLAKSSGLIAAGALSDTLVLTIRNDIFDEGNEVVKLYFDPLMGATNHLDYSGKDTITVTINDNDGPIAQDDAVTIGENAPFGTVVKRLDELRTQSPDTTATYNWAFVNGADEASFNLVNDPVSGWVLTVKDTNAFDFELPDHDYTLNVRIFGVFHADTAQIQVTVTNVQENPIAPETAVSMVVENSFANTAVDTLFPGENSGWNLAWTIEGGTGASNFIVTTNASGAGVIQVKPGAVLDYEATKSQTLVLVLTNQSGLKDTTQVTVNLANVLEYTQVSITRTELGSGKVETNPKTIYINSDTFEMTWRIDGKDSNEVVKITKEGLTQVIRKFCDPTKDFCGADTLTVRKNTEKPVVTWEEYDPIGTLPRYTVETPRNPADTVIYFNDPTKVFGGKVTYVDSLGKIRTADFETPKIFKEGNKTTLTYTYTDIYGNTVKGSVVVLLDTTPPDVKILSPRDGIQVLVYNVDVVWTVDGITMDTLNRASLEGGENLVIRNYVDLAGNIGSDTVVVNLKIRKNDINVSLIEPLIVLDPKSISSIAKDYPTRKDEFYSLSVLNQKTLEEEEAAYGSSSKTHKVGMGQGRVYNGTRNVHLGPTLRIEAKFQPIGGLNGEGMQRGGTLADLLERTRDQGIADKDVLCGESMPADPVHTPIWTNRVQVEVQLFDNLGQYVDRFLVSLDSIPSQYLNDGGVGVFYFSLEPDKQDMKLKSSLGRALANGPYILRGIVKATSTYLYCSGEFKKGQRVGSTGTILNTFGYRRAE